LTGTTILGSFLVYLSVLSSPPPYCKGPVRNGWAFVPLENKYLLQPIPFSVRSYTLPDLFAGKMHALLCRRWKNRVKGRDWFDLIWYCAYHPELHLSHLEQRMRQSGHWEDGDPLAASSFERLVAESIGSLDVDQARQEVLPFVRQPEALEVWSREFFAEIVKRIKIIEIKKRAS